MENFRKLKISEEILKSLSDMKFEKPTEIQEKTIPLILEGKDVIAGAATGSGKTLAFGAGIIQNSVSGHGIQALILTPTRELADQIKKNLRSFSRYKPLSVEAIYGGVSIVPQIKGLHHADVVVGTPGRMLDHIERGTIDLDNVRTLVLDEADRMLDMGFIDDVERIIQRCPQDRQTLLFSATIEGKIAKLARKYMMDAVEVFTESQVDPTKLSQSYYDVQDNMKFSLLVHLLKNDKSGLVMVFCNTQRNTDFVAKNLRLNGINALPIHGGHSQDKRTRIMNQFHSKDVDVLVCTDVAGRGIDIKDVSHVYNYDVPNETNNYVHRIGRTARAGTEGKAITILASRDYDNFSQVLRQNPGIEKIEVPGDLQKVEIVRQESRGGFGGGRFGGRDFRSGNRFGGRGSRPFRGGGRERRFSRDEGRGESYHSSEGGEGHSGGYNRGTMTRGDGRGRHFGGRRFGRNERRFSRHNRR
jgi:ATP-dependent RNA helicase DeaD